MPLPDYGPVEQGQDMRRVVDAVLDAYARSGDPVGDADLDNDQPHPTHLPLGIIRLARRCAVWRDGLQKAGEP